MDQKMILVTGAKKGIGFEVVRQLARLGHAVLLGARDEAKGREAVERLNAEDLKAEFLLLDVADPMSIAQAVEVVRRKSRAIDVIINNAAVLLRGDQSLSQGTSEVFHLTMRTNVFGPVQVVRHFLSLMRPGGRIIMISSGGGSMTDPVEGWAPVYCISKSALNAVTRQLAYELAVHPISVNAYCPGWVHTDMGGRTAPRNVQRGAETAVWLATTTDDLPTGKFFRDRKVIPW
jgi:NAD(P)-dependent dehydrogenase (short-subunit alcohol dehydrogenase family)